MSSASIGSRVGAFVRTPLGDRKPYAGGYWLKTLTDLERLPRLVGRDRCRRGVRGRPARGVRRGRPGGGRGHAPRPERSSCRSPTSRRADRVRKQHGHGRCTAGRRGGRTGHGRRATGGRGQGQDRAARRAACSARGRRSRRGPPSDASPGAGRRPRPGRAARATAGRRPGARRREPPTRLSASGLAALQAELQELTTVTRPAIVARIVGGPRARRPQGELGLPRGPPGAVVRRGPDPGDRGSPAPRRDHRRGRRRRSRAARLDGRRRGTARRRGDVHPRRIERGQPGCRSDLGGLADRRRAPRRVAGDEVEAIIPSGRLRFKILAVR